MEPIESTARLAAADMPPGAKKVTKPKKKKAKRPAKAKKHAKPKTKKKTKRPTKPKTKVKTKKRKAVKAKKKTARKSKPKVGAVVRSERLDMRLTKKEKAKIYNKAKKTRRTVTSLVIEAIEKIR